MVPKTQRKGLACSFCWLCPSDPLCTTCPSPTSLQGQWLRGDDGASARHHHRVGSRDALHIPSGLGAGSCQHHHNLQALPRGAGAALRRGPARSLHPRGHRLQPPAALPEGERGQAGGSGLGARWWLKELWSGRSG